MATIKLKKPASTTPREAEARTPVRGVGAGVKQRPTLAQAQAQRAEREARYQEQLRQRYGDRPAPPFTQRGEPRPAADRGAAAPPRDAGRVAPFPPHAAGRPERAAPARRDAAPPARRADNSAFGAPARARHDALPAEPQRRDSRLSGAGDAAPRRPADDLRSRPQADARPRPTDAQRLAPHRGKRPDRSAGRNDWNDRGDRDDVRRLAPAQRSVASSAATPAPRPAPRHGPANTAFGAKPQRPLPRGRDDDDDDHFDTPPEHAAGSLRLSKRMSELGIASRREADEWIAKGWVRVDDQVVSGLGSRVMPEQRITVDAKAKYQQAQRVTVLINKPVGYVSGQAEDGYEPALVLVTPQNQWREDHSGTRFLREHLKSLVPAGRLDIDSVGLLVLTQDGRIAKQLIGEDSQIEKEYLVRVARAGGDPLPVADLELLRHGLELDGEALLPATVEWVNDDQLRFVLRQGKKRQIRRMCEAVGLQVLGLKRVRIGAVMLGDLPTGEWRYLRREESFG